MAGMIKSLLSAILVGVLCATTLLKPGLAEVSVTPSLLHFLVLQLISLNVGQRFLAFKVAELKSSNLLTGKFENVGPACCKAFTEEDAKCWPKMFPLNPLFPPLLKDGCARIDVAAPAKMMPKFSVIPGSPVDLSKCLSSLVNVQGCLTEIYKSIFTGKFGNIGPMCCKTFSTVDAKCWPQMFPLNPFFPPLLKNECSRINGAAPTDK